jgi:manganese-dependent inorganic pyrophosphatase
MPPVYVTGHRNPDLDSIGSAIGYAELKGRVDHGEEYTPVRLGDVNAQTAWALERAGLEAPELLEHVRLRASDVMREFPITADVDDPVRDVGLAMAERELDIVPVLDADGILAGVITERELARMYIRESRGASTFADRPVTLEAIVGALDGTLVSGTRDTRVTGRVWVVATDAETTRGLVKKGDIVVVGARPEVQELAIDCGAAVLVTSHGVEVDGALRERAGERGTALVVSKLDSYVTGRMIQLAVPCGTVMTSEPLVVAAGDIVVEISERVKESGVRAAVVVNERGCPLGVVRRADLVDPPARRVILVDHAERGQSVEGIEEASILEILDHHHIGSIETRLPVKATFDPVGSTATLVVERFRREGREPRPSTATMLLAALLSDTVILTGPTTTDRDHAVAGYLHELLGVDPRDFGRELFEAGSDVSEIGADLLATRDAKAYTGASGRPFWIAQIEVVGGAVLERRAELLDAIESVRAERGAALFALMVTDIAARGTELFVAGEVAAAERAFAADAHDGSITLPGVMSRKKQVAPRLLTKV